MDLPVNVYQPPLYQTGGTPEAFDVVWVDGAFYRPDEVLVSHLYVVVRGTQVYFHKDQCEFLIKRPFDYRPIILN